MKQTTGNIKPPVQLSKISEKSRIIQLFTSLCCESKYVASFYPAEIPRSKKANITPHTPPKN